MMVIYPENSCIVMKRRLDDFLIQIFPSQNLVLCTRSQATHQTTPKVRITLWRGQHHQLPPQLMPPTFFFCLSIKSSCFRTRLKQATNKNPKCWKTSRLWPLSRDQLLNVPKTVKRLILGKLMVSTTTVPHSRRIWIEVQVTHSKTILFTTPPTLGGTQYWAAGAWHSSQHLEN